MTPVLTKVTTRGSALLLYCNLTRSSAVADRPRDASRLSVVSFNSTIPRTQCYIISYFGFGFISAYN